MEKRSGLTYDEEGYDNNGFNRERIHRDTQTRFDLDGYDYQGYNRLGYNRYGFSRRGDQFNKKTSAKISIYDANEENEQDFSAFGHNPRGFSQKTGINKYTKAEFDRRGFLIDGTHIDTGTKYNKYGYDAYGYNEQGYNEYGWNKELIHEETQTKYGPDGYDVGGYDLRGFPRECYGRKANKYTGNLYDREGFNKKGLWHGKNEYSGITGFNINGWNIKGINQKTGTLYDIEGYDRDGYSQEGYDRDGYDRLGINQNGINQETGKRDIRIEFAERFIASEKSIEQFAKEKQLPVEEVIAKIEEIRKSPFISEAINVALNRNANKFLGTLKTKKEQLLSGKIAVIDIMGIHDVIRLCDFEERKKVTEMLIKAMTSHEISILQYRDILGIKEINSSLPQNIIAQIEQVKRFAGPLAREMYREIDRLKPYRMPYRESEGETLGYMEKPTDKKPKMVTITGEHRDMARQYLIATDEFICNKTMQATLMKIVKGELGIEQIERARKESELRKLQKEDGELGELIEQSEQFIKENQEKSQSVADTEDKGEEI